MGTIIVNFVKGTREAYHNTDAVEKVISYILREDARIVDDICGTIGVFHEDIEGIVQDFMKVKEIYHKKDGVQIKHIVVSFSERPILPRRKLHEKIIKMVGKLGKKFQIVYAVHEDTDNWHVHIGVNSVGYDGQKLIIDYWKLHKIKQLISRVWKNCNYHLIECKSIDDFSDLNADA